MGCAGPEVTSHKTTQRVEENLEETLTDQTMISGFTFMVLYFRFLHSGTKAVSCFHFLSGLHVPNAAQPCGDATSQKGYQRQIREQISHVMQIDETVKYFLNHVEALIVIYFICFSNNLLNIFRNKSLHTLLTYYYLLYNPFFNYTFISTS